MRRIGASSIATALAALAAAPVSQASGQTLSSACASALHEGAYSESTAVREGALTSFKAAGCLDAITAAYGVAGVPRRGDVTPLALAAIAYKSLLAASSGGVASFSPAGIWSGGLVIPGGSVVPGIRGGPSGGGSWSVSPRPVGPGGRVDTVPLPRMNSGGSIDATPVR